MIDRIAISRSGRRSAVVLAVALVSGAASAGEMTAPALWGYGMKTCSSFLMTVPRDETPLALADEDYLRHRQWLAGFVSGLNLATNRDVLRGAALDAAMTRIGAICKDAPAEDFFNAALRLVRSLSEPEGDQGAKGRKSK